MLFHITDEFTPEVRDSAQKRFKETGALPSDGVIMHGRWHSVAGHAGCLLAESADAVAICRWMQDWTDLLRFEVTPVLTDEEVATVIG